MSRGLLFVAMLALLLTAVFEPRPTVSAISDTFIVTSTADTDGATCAAGCTLRQAINAANANGNPGDIDRIEFAIPGDGVKTITLASALPTITQPVVIDGETQGIAQCAAPRMLLIVITGGTTAGGLNVEHAAASELVGTTIRGLALNFLTSHGLEFIHGAGHVAECLHVGTSVDGMQARFNTPNGIVIGPATNGVRIGGTTAAQRNLITANSSAAIYVEGANATILGNYIGTDATGNGLLAASQFTGVSGDFAENLQVGGLGPGEGNVISGFLGAGGHGVYFVRSTNLQVRGNIIGLGADGDTLLGNSGSGIFLDGQFQNQPITGAVIEGNTISGNSVQGIALWPGVSGTQVLSNIIGLNAAGNAARPNGQNGIAVVSFDQLSALPSDNTVIGTGGNGNIISGNLAAGIQFQGDPQNSSVEGNNIGYAADGTTEIPNGGTAIDFFATQTMVGATVGGDGDAQNRIYAEGTGGGIANAIAIRQSQGGTPTQIEVRANAMRSTGHAINLRPHPDEGENVVTENDPAPDSDTGPNLRQNFPVLTVATAGTPSLVSGTLTTAPNQQFTLRFFASATCDTATARQAERFVGTAAVAPDGSGTVAFASLQMNAGNFSPGEFITATATDTNGNTSELSSCLLAAGIQPAPQILSVTPNETVANSGATEMTVTGTNFTAQSIVRWNGNDLTTTFMNSTTLKATVARSQIGDTKTVATIVVANGADQSGNQSFFVRRSSSDVDCDGTSGPADALFLLEILAGLATNNTSCPNNVTQDGAVDLADALWIRREVAGLIDQPLESLHP